MEKSFISKYRNQGLLFTSKRIFASLIDGLILVLISICLLFASNAIIQNIPSYQKKIHDIDQYRINMYEICEEAKLYEYKVDNNGIKNYETPIEQEDLFIRYAISNIMYTCDLNKTEWDNKFIAKEDNPYEYKDKYNVTSASFSNDYLATFYTTYAKKYNENNNILTLASGDSYVSNYKKVLKNHSLGAEWNYYEGDDSLLPSLKLDYAHTLLMYIINNDGGDEGLKSYNYLASQYKEVFNEAATLLFKSDRYQTSYKPYMKLYRECAIAIDVSSIFIYIITFILGIVLPIIFIKNGRTVGLKLFKGYVINQEGLDVSKKEIIIRSILLFISYFPIMVISNFFASGVNSGWLFPIFSIGNFNLSLFNISTLFLIIPIINLFLLISNKNKQTLTELSSKTKIIDLDHYQEPVVIKEETKEETKTIIIEDKPYFDSSSFNNTEREKAINDIKDEEIKEDKKE